MKTLLQGYIEHTTFEAKLLDVDYLHRFRLLELGENGMKVKMESTEKVRFIPFHNIAWMEIRVDRK